MIPDQNLLVEIWGPAGLIIFTLLGAVVFLYREVKGERKLNAELQEKRFDDIKVYNDGIEKHREFTEKMLDDYRSVFDQLKFTVDQLRSKS